MGGGKPTAGRREVDGRFPRVLFQGIIEDGTPSTTREGGSAERVKIRFEAPGEFVTCPDRSSEASWVHHHARKHMRECGIVLRFYY